jgi:hypothetical protein
MRFLSALLFAGALFAQSSNYPSALDTDTSLYVTKDNVQTTLTAAMGSGDSVAVVVSGSGFAANMIATVCDSVAVVATGVNKCSAWEHMLVTSVSGNQLSVTRGVAGTSARTHVNGAVVSVLIDSAHQTALKSAVVAIETALGPNLNKIVSSPIPSAAAYTFTAQSCNSSLVCAPGGSTGGSLIIGNNTLTMTPVPAGVNGSDSNHRFWVSGGAGTAEACLITGGAGVAGGASGTIIINCANTHSGAFTVGTATGYIQEGMIGAGAGGTLMIPAGTYTLNAALQVPSGLTLMGAGQSVVTLQVANSQLAGNAVWQVPTQSGTYCVVCLAPSNSSVRLRDFTIDANGANQTWIYYGDITGVNTSQNIVERVTVKNHPISGGTGVTMQFLNNPASSFDLNTNNVMRDVNTIGIASCTVPNGGGAYYLEGRGTRLESAYAVNFCDSPVVLNNCDNCSAEDSVMDVGSGQMATATYSIEGATNSTIANSRCIGTGTNGNRFCVGIENASTLQTQGTKVVGMTASHSSTVLKIGKGDVNPTTNQVLDTQVVGLTALNAVLDCVTVYGYTNKLDILGGNLTGCGGAGIGITSTGSTTQVAQNIHIDHLVIDHAAAQGIVIANSTTGPPVTGLKITNSYLGDTYGSPTQTYGINIGVGTVADATITGNTMLNNVTAAFLYSNTWGSNAVLGPNITSTGDPDWGYRPVLNWNSGNGRGRLQSLYSSVDASNNDWTFLSENFRHTNGDQTNGTIDNAGNGTAELAVEGTNGGGGKVALRTGGVNAAPTERFSCTTAVCLASLATAAPSVNYIASETGANNAIVATLTGVTPGAGTCGQILLAHSLQAGANTLNLNSIGVKSIKKHTNPASDIGTAYVSGSLFSFCYDGTVMQDMSQ